MKVVVSRASHDHQVPQVGLPQIAPVTIVIAVKSSPTSADALAQ